MNSAEAVSAQGLTKSFGAATLLAGVDLTCARGELVTRHGPPGCGKTTLLRLIAGLASPDPGRVGSVQYIEESPGPTLAAVSSVILAATLALLLIADRAVGLHRLAGLAE